MQSVEKVLAESALEPTVARAKAVQDLVSGFRAGLLEHFKAVRAAETDGELPCASQLTLMRHHAAWVRRRRSPWMRGSISSFTTKRRSVR